MLRQFAAALLFLFAATASTSAQSTLEQAAKNARDQFTDIKNRSIEMERAKRDAARTPQSADSTVRFPEIKEDFEEIQKINDEILRLNNGKTALDFAAVSKRAAEINRRAARLKSNLFSAEPKQKKNADPKPPAAAAPDVKRLLSDLDKAINRFVHSSIFQNIKLVDSRASLDAQNDLEAVIKITSQLKKSAKK